MSSSPAAAGDRPTEPLRLLTGGRLEYTSWRDNDACGGEYVSRDVTEQAPDFLWETCGIDGKATLGDALSLLHDQGGAMCRALGPRARMVVEEMRSGAVPPGADLEALELYWSIEADSEEGVVRGNAVPCFHGIGRDKVRYSVEFDPIGALLPLTLRLADAYVVPDGVGAWITLGRPEYTLGQILYGAIHELTWHGTATERDELRRDIEAAVKDGRPPAS